jgi:NitT/TauT family transport system permease protein
MTNAFRPNGTLSASGWTVLLAIQTAILVAVWRLGNELLVPGPFDVLRAGVRLFRDEGMAYELMVSLETNVEAIALSAAVSLGLAYLTVLPAVRPLVAVISKWRFFGMTGFIVVFTMAFGGGHRLKVSLLTFGMSVFFVTSMAAVIARIPKDEWDQARSLRMSPWRAVWEIVILGTADEAFEVLRQNAAIGWMMLTLVEGLVRSEGGVGVLMLNQSKYFKLDSVFAIQLTILLVGVLQDRLIVLVKNHLCPYSTLTLERQ